MSFQSAASSAVWIFGRYSTSDAPVRRSGVVVVDDVQRHVDDRGREAAAVGVPDVAIVEVQARGRGRSCVVKSSCAASRRRSAGRRSPVAQSFISAATCSATVRNTASRWNRQLQVPLIVERHRRRPGRARPRRRTSSRRRPTAARRRRCGCSSGGRARGAPPGPCPESTAAAGRAGISLPSKRPARASLTVIRVRPIVAVGSQKVDPLAVAGALRAPFDARPHQCAAIVIQWRERARAPRAPQVSGHRRSFRAVHHEIAGWQPSASMPPNDELHMSPSMRMLAPEIRSY